MTKRKCLAGAILTCVLIALAGCGSSPRDQGIKFKKAIESALQRRDLQGLQKELSRLVEYVQNLPVKNAGEFFAAWPDDSFKPWIDEMQRKAKELIEPNLTN